MRWQLPTLTLKWGNYFPPDPEEESKLVDTTIKAKDARLITRRTAVEKIRRQFGIENVDEYLETLEKEIEEHGSTELAMQTALIAAKQGQQDPKANASTEPVTNE